MNTQTITKSEFDANVNGFTGYTMAAPKQQQVKVEKKGLKVVTLFKFVGLAFAAFQLAVSVL